MRIYLAAPIFTEKDQIYNELLGQAIEERFPDVELYMPQRNKSINDKTKCADAEDIARGDFDENLNHTDIVVAVVDGDVPAIGTTLEIGYFAHICQEERDFFENEQNNIKITLNQEDPDPGETHAYWLYLQANKPVKSIISLYTDSREPSNTVNPGKIAKLSEFAESQFSYLNLLLVGALKRYGVMCRTREEVLDNLEVAIDAFKQRDQARAELMK